MDHHETLRRLHLLRDDWAEHVPPDHVDMSVFIQADSAFPPSNWSPQACNSAACLVGWLPYLPNIRPLAEQSGMYWGFYGWLRPFRPLDPIPIPGGEILEALFGISFADSYNMTFPYDGGELWPRADGGFPDEITHADVLCAIDLLIKKYSKG